MTTTPTNTPTLEHIRFGSELKRLLLKWSIDDADISVGFNGRHIDYSYLREGIRCNPQGQQSAVNHWMTFGFRTETRGDIE
jgi:hypothetical protein